MESSEGPGASEPNYILRNLRLTIKTRQRMSDLFLAEETNYFEELGNLAIQNVRLCLV